MFEIVLGVSFTLGLAGLIYVARLANRGNRGRFERELKRMERENKI